MTRVGFGWDMHRLAEGKRLLLGGVEILSRKGADAHSDGDVLLHAIIDALFGAAAAGDIGEHFPDTDPAWEDAAGADLLDAALGIVNEKGFKPSNVDCTILLEEPKLGDTKKEIRRNIARLMGLPDGAVNVKAKTAEGMGPVAKGKAVEAYAVVLVESG